MRNLLLFFIVLVALSGCTNNGPTTELEAGTYTATTPDLSSVGDKEVLTMLTNKLNQEPATNLFILRYKCVSPNGTTVDRTIIYNKAKAILEKKAGAWYEGYSGVTHNVIYQTVTQASSVQDLAKYGATSTGSAHESKAQ